MYKSGDTVRLEGSFKGFDGSAVDPDTITLTIYDRREAVVKTYTGAELTKTATGIYAFDYVLPDIPQMLWYEFKGILDGNPMLTREPLSVSWA